MTTATPRRLFTVALCLAAVAALAAVTLHAQPPQAKPDVALKAAIDKETGDGDLKGAIEAYRKLADGTDRAVAAQALLRMGQCYEKLGATQGAEARKAYETVVAKFGDQSEAAAQARARLAALSPARETTTGPPGGLRSLYHGEGRPLWEGVTLSSDGRYAVFTEYRRDSFIVRDLTTGREAQVSYPSPGMLAEEWRGTSAGTASGFFSAARISPDGRQIAYSIHMYLREGPKITRLRAQVRLVNRDGTGTRLVLARDGGVTLLRWSADGKSVLAQFGSTLEATASLESIRCSDGFTTRLAGPYSDTGEDDDDTWEELSPDGRFVAFHEESDAGASISVIDTRSGKRTRVIGPVKTKVFVAGGWVPDGSGIVLATDQGGTVDLKLLRILDGVAHGAPELIRADVGEGTGLAVAADGSYYFAKTTLVARRYVATLDPTTGKVVGTPALTPELQIACGYDWSRDGSTVVAAAKLNKGDLQAPCTLVTLRSLSDGRERVVSPGLSDVRWPRLSPDGRSVVVFGRKDGTFGVYRIDLATSAATLITEAPAHQQSGELGLAADWTPDGSGLFLGRIDKDSQGLTFRLVQRDLEAGTERERYSMKSQGMVFFTSMSVSRDGSVCLLVNEADMSRAAVVIPADGGPSRTVYRAAQGASFPWLTWAADGKAIYVPQTIRDTQQTTRKLLRVPTDGAAPMDAGLTLAGMDNIQASPDGQRMLLSAYDNVLEIWAIDRLLPPSKPAAVTAGPVPAKK